MTGQKKPGSPKGKQPKTTLHGAAARSAAGEKLGGRPAGVPNKATANAREAIAAFVEANTPRLNSLLDRIETENGPLAAFKCIQEMTEYHVPKLQRTELTGKDGAPFVVRTSQGDENL